MLFVILLRIGHTWILFGSCLLFLLQISFLIEELTTSLPTVFCIWSTMLSLLSAETISLCTLTGAAAWTESVPPDLLKEPFLSLSLSDCLCGQKAPNDIQLFSSCETFFSPAEPLLSSLSLSASRYVRLLPSLVTASYNFLSTDKIFPFSIPSSNRFHRWVLLSKAAAKIWSQKDLAAAGLTDSGAKIYFSTLLL